jgi:RNA polymerase sigma-70 factor (ECF subfamily)
MSQTDPLLKDWRAAERPKHTSAGRLRLRGRTQPLEEDGPDGDFSTNLVEDSLDPEQSTSQAEAGQFLEEAILSLPRQYRAVVMLRDVE